MAKIALFAFSLSLLLLPAVVLSADNNNSTKLTVKNARPIVGVLLMVDWKNETLSVSSSYIKWAEMGGARVVPIPVGGSRDYYKALFDQINGVIMPGGNGTLVDSMYARTAELIIQTAEEKHAAGVHWPVWAVSLSMQKLIAYYTGNSLAWMTACDEQRFLSLPLDFPSDLDLRQVRLFKDAPDSIIGFLKSRNVTANYHSVCLDVETFKKSKNLTDHFRLVSTNTYLSKEGEKREFVSTIEHRQLPIYGVQWHPEMATFEWSTALHGFSHDEAAILVGQYFANFFVGEARKNGQFFASVEEEQQRLMYSYAHRLFYSPHNAYQEYYEFDIWFTKNSSADSSLCSLIFTANILAIIMFSICGLYLIFFMFFVVYKKFKKHTEKKALKS